jgi:hypothetical protein
MDAGKRTLCSAKIFSRPYSRDGIAFLNKQRNSIVSAGTTFGGFLDNHKMVYSEMKAAIVEWK